MDEQMSPEARRMFEHIEAALKEGLKEFVHKPVDSEVIRQAVDRVLREQPPGTWAERATHALVSPGIARQRRWVWGMPTMPVPDLEDTEVLLAQYEAVQALPDRRDRTAVVLDVTFRALRAYRVSWGDGTQEPVAIATAQLEGG